VQGKLQEVSVAQAAEKDTELSSVKVNPGARTICQPAACMGKDAEQTYEKQPSQKEKAGHPAGRTCMGCLCSSVMRLLLRSYIRADRVGLGHLQLLAWRFQVLTTSETTKSQERAELHQRAPEPQDAVVEQYVYGQCPAEFDWVWWMAVWKCHEMSHVLLLVLSTGISSYTSPASP
jgi:hypothetical protein